MRVYVSVFKCPLHIAMSIFRISGSNFLLTIYNVWSLRRRLTIYARKSCPPPSLFDACTLCRPMPDRSRDWHETALDATKAQDLREKLGSVCASHECQGNISPFVARKFGFNPE